MSPTDTADREPSSTDDELPTASEAVARSAVTFDPTHTRHIPNGIDERNGYAGSLHGG